MTAARYLPPDRQIAEVECEPRVAPDAAELALPVESEQAADVAQFPGHDPPGAKSPARALAVHRRVVCAERRHSDNESEINTGYPHMNFNLALAFHQQALTAPERLALSLDKSDFTYGQLATLAARIGRWRTYCAVRKGDHLWCTYFKVC